ncbi:MAG: DUF1844 domain-containing protein [Candidatus Eremiobacteraeota bacterium]|nr:DUF1844 domain-containing protein [Candidatus Eremiobacteraeota bacterium]
MSSQAPPNDAEAAGFQGQIPDVEPLLTEIIATLSLAAHAYLSDSEEKKADLASAEIAIDVASATFERVKERLRPQERLAITQMLTESRMTFVRKRGL